MANETNSAQSPAGSEQNPPAADIKESTTQQANLEGILAKNKELLSELKQVKSKLKGFEDADEKTRAEKLKAEGKLTELIAEKDKKIDSTAALLKIKETKYLMQKYGLVDDDYSQILSAKLEFDENLEAKNADDVFNQLKEQKPYLFNTAEQARKPVINGQPPAGFTGPGITQAWLNNASPEEIMKRLPEIQGQIPGGTIDLSRS